LAPALRILAGDPGRARALAPRAGRPCWSSWGMESEARHELSRLARRGSIGFRASLWLGALTYLIPTRRPRFGDRRTAEILYRPKLEPLAGTNVMIADTWSPVTARPIATWGCSRRPSATASAPRSTSRRALELQTVRWRRLTWVAHTPTEYGSLPARSRPSHSPSRPLLSPRRDRWPQQIGLVGLLAKIGALGCRRTDRPSSLRPLPGARPRSSPWSRAASCNYARSAGFSSNQPNNRPRQPHPGDPAGRPDARNRTEAASFAHLNGLA